MENWALFFIVGMFSVIFIIWLSSWFWDCKNCKFAINGPMKRDYYYGNGEYGREDGYAGGWDYGGGGGGCEGDGGGGCDAGGGGDG